MELESQTIRLDPAFRPAWCPVWWASFPPCHVPASEWLPHRPSSAVIWTGPKCILRAPPPPRLLARATFKRLWCHEDPKSVDPEPRFRTTLGPTCSQKPPRSGASSEQGGQRPEVREGAAGSRFCGAGADAGGTGRDQAALTGALPSASSQLRSRTQPQPCGHEGGASVGVSASPESTRKNLAGRPAGG